MNVRLNADKALLIDPAVNIGNIGNIGIGSEHSNAANNAIDANNDIPTYRRLS